MLKNGFPSSFTHRVAVVMISYWTTIGLFLASLICLVRRGVIRDIVRDKTCRWVLFLGICGGICIGSLSFLAASNGWEVLSNLFDSLNQPANAVMGALESRYKILDFLPPDLRAEFIFWNVVALIYWTAIGLFFAAFLCVIRILAFRLQTQRRAP